MFCPGHLLPVSPDPALPWGLLASVSKLTLGQRSVSVPGKHRRVSVIGCHCVFEEHNRFLWLVGAGLLQPAQSSSSSTDSLPGAYGTHRTCVALGFAAASSVTLNFWADTAMSDLSLSLPCQCRLSRALGISQKMEKPNYLTPSSLSALSSVSPRAWHHRGSMDVFETQLLFGEMTPCCTSARWNRTQTSHPMATVRLHHGYPSAAAPRKCSGHHKIPLSEHPTMARGCSIDVESQHPSLPTLREDQEMVPEATNAASPRRE